MFNYLPKVFSSLDQWVQILYITMIFSKTVGANAPIALTLRTTLCGELDEEKYAYTVYKSIDKINVSN